jgi:hypothetical protein
LFVSTGIIVAAERSPAYKQVGVDSIEIRPVLTLDRYLAQSEVRLTRWAGYAEDREIVERSSCSFGWQGQRYHAFRMPMGSYLALSECPGCGQVEEV